MADNRDEKSGEKSTEFPGLKDDFVPGVGESTPAAEAAGSLEPSGDGMPVIATSEKGSGHGTGLGTEPASVVASAKGGILAELPAVVHEAPAKKLIFQTRRDFLIYGVSAAAVAAGFWWMLPDDTRGRVVPAELRMKLDSLDARVGLSRDRHDMFMGRVLDFDDDVAEALYSPSRMVPTYSKAEITNNLRNNYDGATPTADFIPDWRLSISGLASGRTAMLTQRDLLSRFARHEQITRLCCVEGWSAIAWWGGLRFSDLLQAYPPAPGSKWASIESSVNLDGSGNSDPYYVSIDLPTAWHSQTLLATHRDGKPLDVEHGAPLRLVVPMKLGLKNIKAITSITYTASEPKDYWNERGYSKYDGI